MGAANVISFSTNVMRVTNVVVLVPKTMIAIMEKWIYHVHCVLIKIKVAMADAGPNIVGKNAPRILIVRTLKVAIIAAQHLTPVHQKLCRIPSLEIVCCLFQAILIKIARPNWT